MYPRIRGNWSRVRGATLGSDWLHLWSTVITTLSNKQILSFEITFMWPGLVAYTIPGVRDANRHFRRPHMFFVSVRHQESSVLGTWTSISWNQVTLLSSPSARCCTFFKVWDYWILNQRGAQMMGNGQGQWSLQFPFFCSVLYCTVLCSTLRPRIYRITFDTQKLWIFVTECFCRSSVKPLKTKLILITFKDSVRTA